MHRNCREFERDTEDRHHAAENRKCWEFRHIREDHAHLGEVKRARSAVEQRESVEERRRRQCAEIEVLHRGFLRATATAAHRDHHVRRKARKFDREEEPDEVVRVCDEHRAREREQEEREVLTAHHADRIECSATRIERLFKSAIDRRASDHDKQNADHGDQCLHEAAELREQQVARFDRVGAIDVRGDADRAEQEERGDGWYGATNRRRARESEDRDDD